MQGSIWNYSDMWSAEVWSQWVVSHLWHNLLELPLLEQSRVKQNISNSVCLLRYDKMSAYVNYWSRLKCTHPKMDW